MSNKASYGNSTKYLAVIEQDWNIITSKHIFKILSEYNVQDVRIHINKQSKQNLNISFGKENLPLFTNTLYDSNKIIIDTPLSDRNIQTLDGSLNKSDEKAKIDLNVNINAHEQGYKEENIPEYQNKNSENTNYRGHYIAVATFHSEKDAEEAYLCFDGTEILNSGYYLDFRFITSDFISKNLGDIICETHLMTKNSGNTDEEKESHSQNTIKAAKTESVIQKFDQNIVLTENVNAHNLNSENSCLKDAKGSDSHSVKTKNHNKEIPESNEKIKEIPFIINNDPRKKVVNDIKTVSTGLVENVDSDSDFYDLTFDNYKKSNRRKQRPKQDLDEISHDDMSDMIEVPSQNGIKKDIINLAIEENQQKDKKIFSNAKEMIGEKKIYTRTKVTNAPILGDTKDKFQTAVSEKIKSKNKINLDDDRFSALFVDKDFEIDVTSKKFKVDPTLREILRERRERKGSNAR